MRQRRMDDHEFDRWVERNVFAHRVEGFAAVTINLKAPGRAPGDALKTCAPNARWVDVGKRCGGHSVAQGEICEALVEAAQHYKIIVRLKGGDPMIFGRADEEITALRNAGIEHHVIPGITAACAAAASLKLSFTARGVRRCVAFSTPAVGENLQRDQSWLNALHAADATALYMASHQRASLSRQMLAADVAADTPVIAAQAVNQRHKRTWHGTVAELAQCPLRKEDGPILLMVGVPVRAAPYRVPTAQNQRTLTVSLCKMEPPA